MYLCKCICGKTINKGDKVFWVEKSRNNLLVPTCSIECANTFKEYTINKLKNKLKSVENQVIEEEILE